MNRAFGVSEYERHQRRTRGKRTRHTSRRSKRRAALKWTIAALVLALGVTVGLTRPLTATGSHTNDPTPLTPWTAADVAAISNCAGANGTSIPQGQVGDFDTPPDRDNGSTSNEHTGTVADKGPLAIWANADEDPLELTLDVSGSSHIIDGLAVTRSHFKMGGSLSQFRHGVEYGQRSKSDKPAFDSGGSDNCYTPIPEQIYRNAPPSAPAGFPLSSQFDPDGNGLILEHYAPNSPFWNAAGAGFRFQCTAGSSPWGAVDTLPDPFDCDTSVGKMSGGVQGTDMDPGLYFVSGEVAISPSNLNANVTVVSGGLLDVSGSTQSNFTPFMNGVLFASEHIGTPSSANSELGSPALKTGGSVSTFQGITVATNGRNELSGSQNSWTCPVMGDRVRLNGSLLYISGEGCAQPTVTTEVHKVVGLDEHVNLGDGASTVEVGTSIHDKVAVASASNTDLTGTITLERFATGDCTGTPTTATWTSQQGAGTPPPAGGTYAPATTVTIDPALPFTPAIGIYSYRATYSGDPNNPGPVVGKCEGPVRVVDARISITPGQDTNAVNDPHTITVTVEVNDGTGWAPAPNGTKPTVTFTPNDPSSKTDNCAGAGTVSGQCTVVINSAAPGVFTANASVTIAVAGLNLTRDTDPQTATVCGGGNQSCGPAVKTYVDARISITGTATNEVGQQHTFTVTVEVNDGSGWADAPDGTTAAVTITPAGFTLVTDTCAAPGTVSGDCTVTINSNAPAVFTAHASATVTVGGLQLTRDTNPQTAPPCGGGVQSCGPATKTYVDARISITPGDETNEVGQSHTITVKVEVNNGSGWANAPDGTKPTVTFTPADPGTKTDNCASTGTVNGECTVVINSAVPGVFTANASVTITVGGLSVTRDTNPATANTPCGGGVQSCGPAVKTYVDARISITPVTDTNEVGQQHTFVVKVEINNGSGWANAPDGTTAAVTITPAGFTLVTDTCAAPGTASGECTVTINSNAPAVFTAHASATVSVGGLQLTRDTDPQTAPPCGGGIPSCGPATKAYVDARISITGTATNAVGQQHTFTVKVEVNSGSGWVNAPDGTKPAVTITPAGFTPVSDNCANPGTTNGECTVVINSNAAGVFSANASVTITVGGLSLTRDTDPTTANTPCGGGVQSCGPAVKTYVDARISITPGDDTNEVGQSHTFTVTVEVNNGSGWANAPNGTPPTVTVTPNPDSKTDNCANPGTTNGQCTVVINNNTGGTFTAHASVTVTVGGIQLTRDTDPQTAPPCGGGVQSCGPATKTYVDVKISIEGTATNAVGEQHTFTVKVEVDNGSGFANAPDGTKPTVTITPAGFTLVSDNCATTGTTNGICTVVINSNAAGIFTANASVTITVGGLSVTRDTNPSTANTPCGGGVQTCGPAVKTYVNLRISLDPLTADNPVNTNHEIEAFVEQNDGTGWTPVGNALVDFDEVSDTANTTFVGGIDTCTTAGPGPDHGTCSIFITSPTAGTAVISASTTVSVLGESITRTTGTAANTAAGGTGNASKTWIGAGATLLIIDEDSIDNGIHYHPSGGLITPDGPKFFSDVDVNDPIAEYGQRTPLDFFVKNVGATITVKTGQTGDEGWFAPTCIPEKWVSGTSGNCLAPAADQPGINAYWGANNTSTIPQSKLDKIKAVMPLRALGLNSLVGKDVCAVVYDSDISINYDRTTFPFTTGNLQGATLGIAAFTVIETRTLDGFSSSTLPQVTIRINNPATCNPTELFNAPVPKSSSVPNDRIAPGSPVGYRQLKVFPNLPLFF